MHKGNQGSSSSGVGEGGLKEGPAWGHLLVAPPAAQLPDPIAIHMTTHDLVPSGKREVPLPMPFLASGHGHTAQLTHERVCRCRPQSTSSHCPPLVLPPCTLTAAPAPSMPHREEEEEEALPGAGAPAPVGAQKMAPLAAAGAQAPVLPTAARPAVVPAGEAALGVHDEGAAALLSKEFGEPMGRVQVSLTARPLVIGIPPYFLTTMGIVLGCPAFFF